MLITGDDVLRPRDHRTQHEDVVVRVVRNDGGIGAFRLLNQLGVLGSEGRYTTKVAVPNAPNLRGLDLYFQGAVEDGKNMGYISAVRKVTIG